MRRTLLLVAVCTMACWFINAAHSAAAVPDEEVPVGSKVESISLFKNGLAFVRRTVDLPGAGIYRLEDVPVPVHGTFGIESAVPVTVVATTRLVEAPLQAGGAIDLQESLVGRNVTIRFRDGTIPEVSGRVIELARPSGTDAWSREYEAQAYPAYGWRPPAAPSNRFLVLETGNDRIFVDPSMIAYLSVVDAGRAVRRRQQVLLFQVEHPQPVMVTVSYLTKGFAWAPDYRVDLLDTGRLVIEQHAVIKNELHAIEDAELRLISGFPSIQFQHVTSPLALRTNWSQFFSQLMADPRGSSPGAIMQQRILSNAATPGADDAPALEGPLFSEGVDLHYQSIGRRSMAEGDALALQVASAEADYRRIVEWIVPDTRTAAGRYIDQHVRAGDPDRYQDAAWDAVEFQNPLPFPMTTAPATITTDGRFSGQQTAGWTNSGERARLRITKALSIRTRAHEQEEPAADGDERNTIVYLGGNDFRKVAVKGELVAKNHRAEAVDLVIRRQFSGELLEAEAEPSLALREEGVYSVNPRNELTWNIPLKPGEERRLTYRYSVLVDH